MTRGEIIAIGLVATLLVSSGGGAQGPAAGTGGEAGPSEVDAAAISDHLASLNPLLSERQQQRIAAAVLRCGDRHALDPSLVVAVIAAESGARPWVRSGKGAVGLMQVMPHMRRGLSLAGAYLTGFEAGLDSEKELEQRRQATLALANWKARGESH